MAGSSSHAPQQMRTSREAEGIGQDTQSFSTATGHKATHCWALGGCFGWISLLYMCQPVYLAVCMYMGILKSFYDQSLNIPRMKYAVFVVGSLKVMYLKRPFLGMAAHAKNIHN